MMLATSIGIQNTTINQNTYKTITMDNQSYWSEYFFTNQQNIKYGIESYRTIDTYNPLNTEAIQTKQRILEYYNNDTQMNFCVSQYYILFSTRTNINVDLNVWNTTITGLIQNQYNIQFVNLKILKDTYGDYQDTAIDNFLDGQEYTTRDEYRNIVSHINTYMTNIETEETSLTQQNYTDSLNNLQINWQTPSNEVNIGIQITITYIENSEQILPYQESYSPFYNYAKSINYEYRWQINVNPGGTGEIVDIPGMMFTILGMPFAFVAQAFDLTVFPGTAYAVNLSHIFLAIAGAGILLFIIKKVIK